MENWKKNRLIYLASALILLSCIVLRFLRLDDHSLWQDELALSFHANKSLSGILHYTRHFSFHPPLFYIFYKFWISFVEFSEVNLRIYHVILGILSAIAPLFFSKIIGRSNSLIFSLILMSNLTLIKWSQEGLVYASTIFILILFILFLDRATNLKTTKSFIFPAVLIFIMNYLNYFGLLLANIYLVVMLVSHFREKDILKKLFSIFSFSVISFIPWVLSNHLFRSVLGLQTHREKVEFWNKTKGLENDLWDVFIFMFNNNLIFFFTLLFISLLSIKNYYSDKAKLKIKMIIFSVIAYYILIFLGSLSNFSLYVNKYFIVLIPIIMYAMVYVIRSYNEKVQVILVAVIFLLNITSYSSYVTPRGWQDFKSPLKKLAEYDQGNVLVYVFNPSWLNLYTSYFNLNERFSFIGKRKDCLYLDKTKESLSRLNVGDFIYVLNSSCDVDGLFGLLKEKNIVFESFDYSSIQLLRITRIQSQ